MKIVSGVVFRLKKYLQKALEYSEGYTYTFHDYRINRKYLKNWNRTKPDQSLLSYELIFYYHKLEKGLCLPNARNSFGKPYAKHIIKLLEEWIKDQHPLDNPIFQGAIETLRSYRSHISNDPSNEQICTDINKFISNHGKHETHTTPIRHSKLPDESLQQFRQLCQARRSLRNFSSKNVSKQKLTLAISLAQLSPSACNRQPCRAHVYTNRSTIKKLLSIQNGNRGFDHTISTLALITGDIKAFFNFSERNEPFLDGGLFTMSLIYGLQSQGIGSCCLNWCASLKNDKIAHDIGAIPSNERILTYLAIGYPETDAIVPRSHRKPVEDVAKFHD